MNIERRRALTPPEPSSAGIYIFLTGLGGALFVIGLLGGGV